MFGHLFRAVPQASVFHTTQFALIGSISFLSGLSSTSKLTEGRLEVSQADGAHFNRQVMRAFLK
jgi:hypothetical protein